MTEWIQTYTPSRLDDFHSNKKNIQTLKKMQETGIFTHLLFTGPSGTGKHTILRAFLAENSTPDTVLWINHRWFKTLESKERFYQFIDTFKSNRRKFIVIENLHRIVSQFSPILNSLLAQDKVILCILDSEEQYPSCLLASTIILRFHPYSHETFQLIANDICKKEKLDLNPDDLNALICKCNSNLFIFITYLDMLSKGFSLEFVLFRALKYEDLCYEKSLRKRLHLLQSFDSQDYSHLDIALHLFELSKVNKLDCEVIRILGQCVEKLKRHESNTCLLYGAICSIWIVQRDVRENPITPVGCLNDG